MNCWLQLNLFFSRLQMVSLLMLSFQEIQLCLKSYHPWITECNWKYNYADTRTFEYLKLTTVLRTQAIKSCWDLQHWVVTSLSQINWYFILKSNSGNPYVAIFHMQRNPKIPLHLSCLKYVCDKQTRNMWFEATWRLCLHQVMEVGHCTEITLLCPALPWIQEMSVSSEFNKEK